MVEVDQVSFLSKLPLFVYSAISCYYHFEISFHAFYQFLFLHTPKCQIILVFVGLLWRVYPIIGNFVFSVFSGDRREAYVTIHMEMTLSSILFPPHVRHDCCPLTVWGFGPWRFFWNSLAVCHSSLLILKMWIPLWLHLPQKPTSIKSLINFSSAPQRWYPAGLAAVCTVVHPLPHMLADWPMLSVSTCPPV